jgi:hypothetical protein
MDHTFAKRRWITDDQAQTLLRLMLDERKNGTL